MKRVVSAVLLAGVLGCSAGPAFAVPDEYDDSQSNPLRVAAYFVYTVGVALEWAIYRPLHYLVSRPSVEPIFGHTTPHYEVGTYSN